MRNIKRRMLLFLLLLTVFPAVAQPPMIFCGTLSPADCDLLMASATAQAALSSATIDFRGQLDMVGVLSDAREIIIGVEGRAAYSAAPARLVALTALPVDTAAAVNMLLDTLNGLDAALTLTMTVSPQVARQAGLPATSMTLDTRLVDGIGYVNLDELDKVAGGMLAEQGLTGWGGINFIELGNALLRQFGTALPPLTDTLPAGGELLLQQMLALLPKYTMVSRTDTGGPEARYETSIDFGALLADPAMQRALFQQMRAQQDEDARAGLQPMSLDEIRQSLALMPQLGQGITFKLVRGIDMTSMYTTFLGLTASVDLAPLRAATGQAAAGSSYLSLTLESHFSGFNATTITAPADAKIAATDLMLQLLTGGIR